MSDYPPPPPPPPQPGDPTAYGQPPTQPGYQPYQPYSGYTPGPPPNNNLVWAIISILCCTPGGIVAIVYASQVDGKWARGDYAGAQQAAKNARTWAIVSIVGSVALGVLYVLAMIVFGALGAGTSSDF